MLFFVLTPHFRPCWVHFSYFQVCNIIWYPWFGHSGSKMGRFFSKKSNLELFSKLHMLQCTFLVLTPHFRPRWVHFSHFQVPKIIGYSKFGHGGSKNRSKRAILGRFSKLSMPQCSCFALTPHSWTRMLIFGPTPPFSTPLSSNILLSDT